MNESGESKYFLVTFHFGVRIINPFVLQEVEAFEACYSSAKTNTLVSCSRRNRWGIKAEDAEECHHA